MELWERERLTYCTFFYWWQKKDNFILAQTTATHPTSMARQVNESVLNGEKNNSKTICKDGHVVKLKGSWKCLF